MNRLKTSLSKRMKKEWGQQKTAGVSGSNAQTIHRKTSANLNADNETAEKKRWRDDILRVFVIRS